MTSNDWPDEPTRPEPTMAPRNVAAYSLLGRLWLRLRGLFTRRDARIVEFARRSDLRITERLPLLDDDESTVNRAVN